MAPRSDVDMARRVVYVRPDERELWDNVAALARALGIPLSAIVSAALRGYPPLIAWETAKDAARAYEEKEPA